MTMRKDGYYKTLSLPEGKSEAIFCDGNNLYMRLRKGKKGITKSWLFIYTPKGARKQLKVSVGIYPSLTLASARKKALEFQQSLSEGRDIREQRKVASVMTGGKNDAFNLEQTIESVTFGQVAELFFAQVLKREQVKIEDEIKQATIRAKDEGHTLSDLEINEIRTKRRASKDIRSRLDNYLLPKLSDISMRHLNKPLVIKSLEHLEAKGVLETIKRCCTIANQIGDFAETHGYVELNKFSNLTKAFVKPRSTPQKTVKPEQIVDVMSAMGRTNIKVATRAAFELQVHLLGRSSEIAKLRWDEYNKETGVIKIGGYRMKGSQSHIIPLSKHAQSIVEFMRQCSGNSEYIFPSAIVNGKTPYLNPQSVNSAMKRAGLGSMIVSHGLRSVGSTALNDALKYGSDRRFDKDQIEVCLAHMDKDGIRQIYNNAENLIERREILSWWSSFVVEQTGKHYSLVSQLATA
ncbi:tyrosine-type recombinase/integrase [Vibrio breoganii]|uniref:tyrosine-type recombinase/integrase n=1 Tax=Vibrio breoganii TaxID=553239 RepID=UPI001F537F45|nr:tyrosine-type recombinase/integrase [Vibrio breoganii]